MTSLTTKISVVAVAAGLLWIVPSIGTQGMGTLGQRFSHPDDGLITGASMAEERAALQRVDERVSAALGR